MTEMELTGVQDRKEEDLEELMNRIRREKFDLTLPQVMREHKIDMWIQVMREGSPDPLASDLGSNSGVFIFTDRGNDRIERAVFDYSMDLVRECGAYDIIAKPKSRLPLDEFYKTYGAEWPGGPKTELDYRFEGVGEFVAQRDPKRIAVNYLEKLGSPVEYEIPWLRSDGISYTDYKLLVKTLGDKYAKRIVSAEYLITDYLARPVKSEILLYKQIREMIAESIDRDFNKIVPGVTKFSDLEGNRSVVDKDGNRRRGDYVLQRGDLICLAAGKQSGYPDYEWKFGNFNEVVFEYVYILGEGENEPPPWIRRAWNDALKVRKILEMNIRVGRTALETFELLKKEIEEAGFIYIDRQVFNKEPDRKKTQVPLDMHAAGKGIYAPRIGAFGPDWQRDMILPMNHHFYFEYWVYVPVPEWGEGRYLSIQLHDGAIVTKRGVEYFYPPPKRIRIVK
jgi:hypothetical protein